MDKIDSSLSEQFVTFTLAGEEYAVDVFRVKEVIDPPPVTQVPNMPDYIPGVINLRGIVTPVVDLRYKLGLGKTEQTTDTRILIVQVEIDGKETPTGIIADKVSQVTHISKEEMKSPPEMGTRIRSEFLHGMGEASEDHFLLILDIDKVLAADEMLHVIEQAEEQETTDGSDENASGNLTAEHDTDATTQQE